VIVRPETAADRAVSIAVQRAAFEGPVEASIVEAVADEPGSLGLVAEVDGVVVGHVLLSVAHVGEDEVLALGPIGVLSSHRGRGIGTALVFAALDVARAAGACAVILLGDPAWYGPRGFESAARYGLANPYAGRSDGGLSIAEEHFQIAVLDPRRVAELRGEVRWHPAFG
jgi:putative acetyltransferase